MPLNSLDVNYGTLPQKLSKNCCLTAWRFGDGQALLLLLQWRRRAEARCGLPKIRARRSATIHRVFVQTAFRGVLRMTPKCSNCHSLYSRRFGLCFLRFGSAIRDLAQIQARLFS
jgi:hypothetical protein